MEQYTGKKKRDSFQALDTSQPYEPSVKRNSEVRRTITLSFFWRHLPAYGVWKGVLEA